MLRLHDILKSLYIYATSKNSVSVFEKTDKNKEVLLKRASLSENKKKKI